MVPFARRLRACLRENVEAASAMKPAAAAAARDDKFQFERNGYFVADREDHTAEKPVFNLAVGLKDSWGK